MNYIATNLRNLRARRKATQDDVAFVLKISRSTYNNYESGLSEPKIETIIMLADYYLISIDTLVRKDLRMVSDFNLRKLKIV
jgi:transcriptional regulator with XRE-family HTH domain